MVILVMGVAGSGKSTVGRRLAEALGWRFIEADDLHPAANVAKMSAGVPLDDADRAPWLAALAAEVNAEEAAGRSVVLGCSALKEGYRRRLAHGIADFRVVYLHGARELLARRLSGRVGHFMKPAMLESQLAALEEPARPWLRLEIETDPATLVARIRAALG